MYVLRPPHRATTKMARTMGAGRVGSRLLPSLSVFKAEVDDFLPLLPLPFPILSHINMASVYLSN